MEFIKIKEGVILRKRGCNFKQDTNIIARKKHAEIFLLDSKSFDFLKECNGLNSFGKIRKTYTDIFWEDKCHFTINTILKKFSEIIEVKNKKTPINKNQVIEVDDLECACRIAMWHLTNSCNLKCKHCYYMGGKEIKNIFNKKQIKSITNNLSNIGVEKVNITGGEPLLFKNELKYLVNLLNQKCLFFSVNTNAFEEIDILLDIFKRNNYAESIQVSLDGNKEIHENIRGKKGCYLKTCEHIKQLVNAGIQVRIVSMITRKWIGKEKDIFEIIKELGVKEWLLEVPSEATLSSNS